MYITHAISYGNAWNILNDEYSSTFEEIQNIISQINLSSIHNYEAKKNHVVNAFSIRRFWRSNMKLNDWLMISHTKNYSNQDLSLLGFLKKNISLNFFNDVEVLNRWLYSITPIAYKNGSLNIPVAVVPVPAAFIEIDGLLNTSPINKNIFTQIYLDLHNLEPLNHNLPFLILGVSFEEDSLDIREILSNIRTKFKSEELKIDRCIEFTPEYYQAGLAILTYFGSILREKYPEQNATIKIEQHNLTVRMIIESVDGNIEVIEKALHEYELVLKGQKSAEEFYLSPIKALELKNQLNIFKFQVESQKEIIALQRGQILSLEDIVDKALAPITHPPVTIINQLNNTQTTHINHQKELNQSYDDLDKLIDLADKDSLKKRLERALAAIDVAQNLDDPEEVKNSGGMKQLAKILNEANEVGSEINSLAEKGEQAVELIKNLGRKYNSVAEWCGLPVIPSVFVKE